MSRLCSTFFLLIFAVSAAAKPLIAFERGGSIWVANLDGNGPKKVAKGSAPSLSPDGERIAFHTDSGHSKELVRQIAVADIGSKHITVFDQQIPSRNCQHAIWSPDGAHIIFNTFNGSDWDLAMINSDGSGFRLLRKAGPGKFSVWSECWAQDSRSIYCQDFNHIYQLSFEGIELKKWNVDALFPKGSLSSATNLSLSPTGHALVMDVEMQDETATNLSGDDDGPPSSIWTLDLSTEKTERLTPQGLSAWHPCWLSVDEVLFCTQKREEKNPSIYKLKIDQRQSVRLVPNANNQSVSR